MLLNLNRLLTKRIIFLTESKNPSLTMEQRHFDINCKHTGPIKIGNFNLITPR